jgi:hypothetical protein
MTRLSFPLAVLIPLTASVAVAQAPAEPTIELSVTGGGGGGGEGTITVSGKVKVPPGWSLTVHTLTVRFQKVGSGTTLNAFGAVKGSDLAFNFQVRLKSGSYQVWAVIDAKDKDNREKEIKSKTQSATVQ